MLLETLQYPAATSMVHPLCTMCRGECKYWPHEAMPVGYDTPCASAGRPRIDSL